MIPYETDDGLRTLRSALRLASGRTQPTGVREPLDPPDAADPALRACWHVERMVRAAEVGDPMPPPLSPAATYAEGCAFLRQVKGRGRKATPSAHGEAVGSSARDRATLAALLVSLPPGAYDRMRTIPGALDDLLAPCEATSLRGYPQEYDVPALPGGGPLGTVMGAHVALVCLLHTGEFGGRTVEDLPSVEELLETLPPALHGCVRVAPLLMALSAYWGHLPTEYSDQMPITPYCAWRAEEWARTLVRLLERTLPYWTRLPTLRATRPSPAQCAARRPPPDAAAAASSLLWHLREDASSRREMADGTLRGRRGFAEYEQWRVKDEAEMLAYKAAHPPAATPTA